MGAEVIGRVLSGKRQSYEVKWDSRSGEVYVSYAGWSKCGSAEGAAHAMRVAEAWLHNK